MANVILKQDGFYLEEWNSETRDYDVTLLKGLDWLLEWGSPVELEGKVTLQDIFNHLEALEDFELDLFAKLAEAGNVKAFLEESRQPVEDSQDRLLDYITIHRHVEIGWYKHEGLPVLEDYVVASARVEGDPAHYAYDFTPTNRLMQCEIRLDPHAHFHDERNMYNDAGEWAYPPHNPPFDARDDPNEWPTVNGKPCECAQCCGETFETSIKLGEFFWALFDDIAFHGNPVQRDERMGDLVATKDAYFAGELETVALEDLDLDKFDPDKTKN